MSNKDLKNNIAEYGFLAEHEISMTRARALELCDEEGVPSFERLVERARAKSDLPEEAWAPAKKAVRRPRGRISIGAPSLRFVTALGALVLLISFFAMTNSGKALAEAAIRTIEERVDTIAPLIDTAFKTATEEAPPESTAAAPHHQ
ncbi:MAG: hypothetical protein J6P98_06740, partial [Clostridia bacterium]|nr:hypothetical protein [Clostridia bacterium]